MPMKGVQLIDIKKVVEADGTLLVMEEGNQVPFAIKRIFFVRDVAAGKSRGDHATKKTKLILFPVSGSCTVVVDNGREQERFYMDDPAKGLYIEEMIWRSMQDFSGDCVMMAVCDRPFDAGNETFDSYDDYLKALGN